MYQDSEQMNQNNSVVTKGASSDSNASSETTATAGSNERLDRNERRNSLAAFMRAIKFRKSPAGRKTVDAPRDTMNQDFAQPHPKVRRRAAAAEDQYWVRSAN